MGNDSPIGQAKKKFSSGHPFSAFTELADPLHVDPIGRALHTEVARIADPSSNGTTLNDLTTQWQTNQDNQNAQLVPPKIGDVQTQQLGAQQQDLRRRYASRTLFTGGQGLTDSPSTASTVLLGS